MNWSMQDEQGKEIGFLEGMTRDAAEREALAFAVQRGAPVYLQPTGLALRVDLPPTTVWQLTVEGAKPRRVERFFLSREHAYAALEVAIRDLMLAATHSEDSAFVLNARKEIEDLLEAKLVTDALGRYNEHHLVQISLMPRFLEP